MSLPDFDTMKAMSPEQLDSLLETEFEALLSSIDPSKHDRYKAMFNGCKLRSQAAKNSIDRMIVAQDNMWSCFSKLNALLQDLSGRLQK